ncbi:hypothetical protein PARMER_03369 [Parabacteroides merdae ATCC 43184]|nr:hypothetical protein PARMER_03369 [Parabacteroides merdae ATCC 43184]
MHIYEWYDWGNLKKSELLIFRRMRYLKITLYNRPNTRF